MPFIFRRVFRLLPVVAGLAMAACSGGDVVLPGEGVAANIAMVSGNNQSGVVGATLVDSLIVQVTDSKNRPVQNQQVTFSPANAASGQAVPPTGTTNADGKAGVKWVLGTVAGAQSMIAKPTGNAAPANLSVSFAATAASAVPSKLVKSAGDGQNGSAGSPVAIPPAVKVTDADGNPVTGVAVTFAVATGGGSVVPITPIATDANGVAAVTSWTLGAVAGANTLTATATGAGITGNPATFTATGHIGAAAKLGLAVAPSASAGNGVPLAVQPQIQIQDAAGNGVASANVAISVNISSGGGTLSGGPTVVQTNAGGLAVFSGLTITGPVGPYTLLFTASGLTSASAPVMLGAGNPSGSQSSFSIAPASITAGGTGSTVTVTARDAGGNPIAGAAASVGVSGTNTVTPTPLPPTNASGQTSGVITSDEAGVKTVTVSINGVAVTNPSSLPLTVLPGVPSATISTVSALPTTLTAGGGGSTITVTVKDAFGNPIQGEAVTLASTGATITQPALVTNASGVTTGSVSYATAGPKTVSATVGGTVVITQTANINVNGAVSTTIVGSTDANSVFGEAVQFTATVTGVGTPTGTVTFQDGGSCGGGGVFDTQTLSSGTATSVPISTLSVSGSPHTIRACYSGDGAFGASSGTVIQNVAQAQTTTGATSNTNPSVFGQSVMFTATVTANGPGSGTPTGTVQFQADGANIGGVVALSGGVAQRSTASLPAGNHTITATYNGSTNFQGSQGAVAAGQTVNQANTTTTISSVNPEPSSVGASMQVFFTVAASAPGAGTPTGTVTVTDGTNSCQADATVGNCSFIPASGSPGPINLSASYAGDANFNPSTSAPFAHTLQ